jgi:hypothetical protein
LAEAVFDVQRKGKEEKIVQYIFFFFWVLALLWAGWQVGFGSMVKRFLFLLFYTVNKSRISMWSHDIVCCATPNCFCPISTFACRKPVTFCSEIPSPLYRTSTHWHGL